MSQSSSPYNFTPRQRRRPWSLPLAPTRCSLPLPFKHRTPQPQQNPRAFPPLSSHPPPPLSLPIPSLFFFPDQLHRSNLTGPLPLRCRRRREEEPRSTASPSASSTRQESCRESPPSTPSSTSSLTPAEHAATIPPLRRPRARHRPPLGETHTPC